MNIKAIILASLILVSSSVMAFESKIGFYGIGINNFSNNSVVIDKPAGGVMASFDHGMFGADLYTIGDQAGVDARINFIVSSFTLSLGVGYQNTIESNVNDNTDNWDSKSIKIGDSGLTNFVEISHDTGYFARITVSDYSGGVDFVRSHTELDNNDDIIRVVDNTKRVDVSETLQTIMVGYRHSF